MLFEITRTLRVPRDYAALACVSRSLASLLAQTLFLESMEADHFGPWRAVTQDGYALRHVKEQTPELCLAAVTQEP